MKNYIALQTLFAIILTDIIEKKGVNTDKRAEIIGLVHHIQKFGFFFFRLKLRIKLYTIVDKHAKILQGDDVNISVALKMVRNLVKELKYQRDDHDSFWDDAITERNTINELANNNEILKNFTTYDGIQEPQCPKAQLNSLNRSSEESDVKIYWRELYLQGFDTIIEDLDTKESSEQYQLCAEIEELLLNGITGPDKEPVTNLIVKYYGKGIQDNEPPLYNLDNTIVKG